MEEKKFRKWKENGGEGRNKKKKKKQRQVPK